MRTKLLSIIRMRFTYKYEDGVWCICRKNKLVAKCVTTHKAVDIMATEGMAFSEVLNWYRKIWRLHGGWGRFMILRDKNN